MRIHTRVFRQIGILFLLAVAILSSCGPGGERLPGASIQGAISIPPGVELSPNSFWFKVSDNSGEALYVGKVAEDGSWFVDGLYPNEKYNILFTNIEPAYVNYSKFSSKGTASGGYGGWLSNVIATVGESNNVGSVKVKPLGTIRGKVTADGLSDGYDTSVYIPGTSYIAMTDGEGYFSIFNVPQATYSLRFIHDGYIPQTKENVILFADNDKDSPTANVSPMKLLKNEGTVIGSVTLLGTSDYSGVVISLREVNDPSEIYTEVSAIDGSFKISGIKKSGTYQIAYSKAGYISDQSRTVDVTLGLVSAVDPIALSNAYGSLSGKVQLEDDSKYEGITVLLEKEDDSLIHYSASTGVTGEYSFPSVLAGRYRITYSSNGYAVIVLNGIELAASESKTLADVTLKSLYATISGMVSLEYASNFSGVTVVATNLEDSSLIYSSTTNSSGTFTFPKVAIGAYMLEFSLSGYENEIVTRLIVDRQTVAPSVELKVVRGCVTGEVFLEGFSEHSGIKVSLLGTEFFAMSDSTGCFSISVPPGHYAGGLRYEREDYDSRSLTGNIPVIAGSSYEVGTVTLVCRNVPVVRGTLSGTGSTSAYSNVIVYLEEKPQFKTSVDVDGTWRLEHVPVGDYTLVFQRSGSDRKTIRKFSAVPGPFVEVNVFYL